MSVIALGANEAQTRSCWIDPIARHLAAHRRAQHSLVVCRSQMRHARSYRNVSNILERTRSLANLIAASLIAVLQRLQPTDARSLPMSSTRTAVLSDAADGLPLPCRYQTASSNN
jgi:hypothetical protein